MKRSIQRERRPRRGFTIIEAIVAIALVATALVATVQWLTTYSEAHGAIRLERIARQEAARWMAHVEALPPDALTSEVVEGWTVSDAAAAVLPDATLDVTIDDASLEADERALSARRVEVRVGWSDGAGRVPRRVALVTWRYGKPRNDK